MDEAPEEDVLQLPVDIDPEAPEADLLEQSEVVEVRQGLTDLSSDSEAPEADALEQAEVVIRADPDQEH
jgi:hypothetical protein